LERLLADYLHAAEAGQKVDRDELLRRHPDLAPDLRSFFRNHDSMNRMAGPLQRLAPALPETLGASDPGQGESAALVRYFGDYELQEEIARGGMGVVYRARQVSLNRLVALKMILQGELAGEADVRRFRHEAEAAANLDHPQIVPIYEVGEHAGRQYFSMKLIEQGPRPTGLRDVAATVAKVARAVHHAHQRGILHRDLKPNNLLIDQRGEPHVADFGLAKKVGVDDATRTGAIVGTPAYMAPEQARAEKSLTTAVDVWSLGAILYEWLTGRPPFRGADPLATLMKLASEEPESPRALNPAIDRDLETICLKCLEKDPARRLASAEMLSQELERWLRGEPIESRPVGSLSRALRWCRRHPAGAAALGLAILTFVVTACFAIHLFQTQQRDQRLLAESYFDKGQTAAEQGDVERGLLWFAESLERAPASATDLQAALRLNLAAWHPASARLSKALRPPQAPAEFPTLRLTPTGKLLLPFPNGQVRTLDLATNTFVEALSPNSICDPESISFSPEGKHHAGGTSNHDPRSGEVACLWETVSGKLLRTFHLPSDEIPRDGRSIRAERTAFSADGRTLATTVYLRNVRLWDVATGQPKGPALGPFPAGLHQDDIMALSLSPDGTKVATASRDATARIWDAATGQPLTDSLPCGSGWLRAVAFSPDGRLLLTGGDSGPQLWDVSSGQDAGPLLPHPGAVSSVAFSPDGKLALVGAERVARLWDILSRKQVGLDLHHPCVNGSVAFSPDGRTVVLSGNGQVSCWSLPAAAGTETVIPTSGPIVDLKLSADGRLIATASNLTTRSEWKYAIQLWNGTTGGSRGSPLFVSHKALTQLLLSPDGSRMAAVLNVNWKEARPGENQPAWEVVCWNVADLQQCQPPLELWGHPGTARFTSDGLKILATDRSLNLNNRPGQIWTWDLADGSVTGEPLPAERPLDPALIVHQGGRRLRISHGGDHTLLLLDLDQNRSVGQIRAPGGVEPLATSPDGRFLVTGGPFAQQIWDLGSRKPIGPQGPPVQAIVFSPDSQRIFTGDRAGVLRIRPVPAPLPGTIPQIVQWVEIETCSTLQAEFSARYPLGVQDLEGLMGQLQNVGGFPK